MTAGLPGIGLGGIFVVLCALVIPVATRLRGYARGPTRSLFVLALVSAVAGSVALAITFKVTGLNVFESRIVSFGAPVVVVSFLILILVLLVPELQYRVSGVRPTAPPPTVERLPVERGHQRFPLPL